MFLQIFKTKLQNTVKISLEFESEMPHFSEHVAKYKQLIALTDTRYLSIADLGNTEQTFGTVYFATSHEPDSIILLTS